ncbi:unnamed protein product [Peronospora farinosa]|uniref:Secreted protein n=1 Tax=Peronospora farinosa TaxID=134698 RepID=A0AAV0UEJ7_9STRA|nr:unnamed protein product [Peronospora farinosa]CAI5734803.1 unnamed protein product [Peronospora farinosa]
MNTTADPVNASSVLAVAPLMVPLLLRALLIFQLKLEALCRDLSYFHQAVERGGQVFQCCDLLLCIHSATQPVQLCVGITTPCQFMAEIATA